MAKGKKRRFGSAKANAERRTSGSNYGYVKLPKDLHMFIPETETVVVLDVIPYEVTDTDHIDKEDVGNIWYKRPVRVHKNVGVNKDAVVCPTTFGDPCPICERRQDLIDDGTEYKDDAVKALKPTLRNLYLVRIKSYDGKKKYDKKKLYLFDISDFMFQEEVFEAQLKKKEEFETFFHPEEGSSLEITFDEGSFGGNTFPKPTRVDFIKRKKQYNNDIIDDSPALDEICNVLSYEDIESKFHGETPDEKEEKPKKKDKKKKEKSSKSEKKKDKKEDKSKSDKKMKCPSGHKFGKDTDSKKAKDDCAECDIWNECKAAKKANKKK